MFQQRLVEFKLNRAGSGPLPEGSAPCISSDSFRLQTHVSNPSTIQDWDSKLSYESSNRLVSTLKASAKAKSPADAISLGVARPNPQQFPWESLVISGVNANHEFESNGDVNESLMLCPRQGGQYDLDIALNYGYAAGSPQLLRFITEHVELLHSPRYSSWETCLTCGTTSALEIVFRMLCDRGDWIITECFTYSTIIEVMKSLGLNILSVQMDEGGILPQDLDLKLSHWNPETYGRRPFVLYTIPSGHNPTGTTQSAERRKHLYEVAQKHDLMIIEDDPYYLLQLGEIAPEQATYSKERTTPEEYLENLPPSYLSLDVCGRVLRLDTTSKILSPGLRCGWITGCSQLINKFISHTELSTVAPSGPTQLMLYKLLDETWGHEGFIKWLIELSLRYRRRRDVILEACTRHLPLSICRWIVPTVGMFLWIRVDWLKHPLIVQKDSLDKSRSSLLEIEERLYSKARSSGVVVCKGSWFAPEKHLSSEMHFRLTFAAASEEDLVRAIERFGDSIKAEYLQESD